MLKELTASDKVTPAKLNEIIREVNRGFNLKVSPPLELTQVAGNPQLRLTDSGFMGVIMAITPVYYSSMSSSYAPGPETNNGYVYYYDIEEVYQVKEGEWKALPNGRKFTYEKGYSVCEWNDNIVQTGTIIRVEQYDIYDWRFFAPGGTVCPQPISVYTLNPITTNQLQGMVTVATIDIPCAGYWFITVTGGILLSVNDPSADYEGIGSSGTVYMQLYNVTTTYPGNYYGNALFGTAVTPVAATCVQGGTPGIASGNIGMRTFFATDIPVTLGLQGYVYMDNPCPPVTPPCATFNCGFTGEYGAQIQAVWIGPTCIPGHSYGPAILIGGCDCVFAGTDGEFDNLQDCLNYLNTFEAGCGGSSSYSSMSSPTQPPYSSISSDCSCPLQQQFSKVKCTVTGTWGCEIGGTFILAWNEYDNAFDGGLGTDWQYPYILPVR
jgi:hypothetical protein